MPFNKKKLPLGLALVLLVIGIILTISVLPQKQQTKSKAATGSAVLSLEPSSTTATPLQKNIGDTFTLDLMLDPGEHLITFVSFQVQFDPNKLKPGTTPFAENPAAFPAKVEGPVVENNSIKASLSIGGDPTKAIKEKVKVGTFTFSAVSPGTADIVFSSSQALSSAPTDGAGQNVISTTTPAYLQIGGTPISGTPPSLTPSGGAVPIVSGGTTLSFTVLLHGIGASGDNPNQESSLNNKNPLNPQRTLEVEIYDSDNQSVFASKIPMVYSDEGNFAAQMGLSPNFPTGNYSLKLKTDSYLRRTIPGVLKISAQTTNEIPATSLIAGDINGDNYLNVIDYNAMMDCGYGRINPLPIADPNSVANSKACKAHEPVQNVDLDDNGVINNFDYNLFLRELSVQTGD